MVKLDLQVAYVVAIESNEYQLERRLTDDEIVQMQIHKYKMASK